MSLLAELYAVPWAVRPEVLTAVLGYVERHDVTPEMLARACHFDPSVQEAAKAARWNRYAVHQQSSVLVDGSQALYRRGRVAILPITGPLVRRGNLMSSMSGGPMTSVELLAKDVTRALESDDFDAILLDVDSPGGEAAGIAELAAIISQGRAAKPLTAYVGDLAASAAYWLAVAASEVVLNKFAAVGSIGVVMAVPDPAKEERTHVEIVSSASPNKRPDPTTKEGKRQIQALVDQLGDLFVDDVAALRAVSRETVLEEYGAGGLRVGADAVEHGMADRLGSFEGVLASLAAGEAPPPRAPAAPPDDAAASSPDRPRSAARPASILTGPVAEVSGGVEMGNPLLDNLKLLVAGAEAPDSADRGAELSVQHLSAGPPPSAARPVLADVGTDQRTAAAVDAEATLQARLVAAEAENARLRFAQIQARAEAFARARADELKVFPPEIPHLTALYCLLASDDETHGPLQLGQGKTTTRVAHLENLLASRQGKKELTEELFSDTTMHILTERRPKVDPTAPADEAQLAAYLQQTATGRAVLSAISGHGGERR
jgi:ClpP class serine protease